MEACLQKSADKRPSASDLLNMDWLKNSFLSQSQQSQVHFSANLASFANFVSFDEMNPLQMGVCSIAATFDPNSQAVKRARYIF